MTINPTPLFDRSEFFRRVQSSSHPALLRWVEQLRLVCDQRFAHNDDALFKSWKDVLVNLTVESDCVLDASGNTIRVSQSNAAQTKHEDQQMLRESILQLNPWRIGPYHFLNIDIDAEWRSFKKWDRIASSIYFENATVLDVGCNNGYFCFKAIEAGASWVLGVEPFLLYNAQHEVFRRCLKDTSTIGVMPITAAEIPADLKAFDIALSMGVLYHRKNPIGHLETMHGSLRKRGQLILETMAIDSEEVDVIVPRNKFAKMRGVWFMPTVGMLKRWLHRTGFTDVKIIDVSVTDHHEQRKTEFMPFESLSDFLDPSDHNLTIEGYPTPVRVAISALRAD